MGIVTLKTQTLSASWISKIHNNKGKISHHSTVHEPYDACKQAFNNDNIFSNKKKKKKLE